jgi:hypothetical protein
MQNEFSLGILSIATNGYNQYWENLVDSASRNLNNKSSITFHLFTDDCERSKEFSKKYKHNTKYTNALTKSNMVMDQYISYIPIPLLIDGNPNKILYTDYMNFIRTMYKCLYVIESNGWKYKDLHLGNMMMSDSDTYVLIDYDSISKKDTDDMVASKLFIIKSLLFIDDKVGIPTTVDKAHIYDYVISRIDEKLMEKIRKTINNPKLEHDLTVPYHYSLFTKDTLKLDVIILFINPYVVPSKRPLIATPEIE